MKNIYIFFILSLCVLLGIYWQKPDSDLDYLFDVNANFKKINNYKDILDLKHKLTPNVVYSNGIDLGDLYLPKKKKKFIAMILPSILIERKRLKALREKVIEIRNKKPSRQERLFLNTLYRRYKTHNIDTLIQRLATHPNSIVLAQAAIESGWGSSRFFLEANNIFGIWSFNANEKRIRSGDGRDGKSIYLRRYDNLYQSISDYFMMIAKSPYFKRFKKARRRELDPLKLIRHLQYYSELRSEYVKTIRKVIVKNNLQYYDDFCLESPPLKDVPRLIY